MAASELTAPSSFSKAGGSDDDGSLNVDEFLQATVEEATNRPELEVNLDQHPYIQDYVEYVWINYLLKSQTEPEDQAKLHRSDVWSSWFNVPNRQGRAKLYVYPRPQMLINSAQALRDGSRPFEQYPSLVSFFGETGVPYLQMVKVKTCLSLLYKAGESAISTSSLIRPRGGKSTIISTLVRNAALNEFDDVPIPGNHAERFRSTSAGIHLYCDPKTIDSDVPLFYAGQSKPSLGYGTDSKAQTARVFVVALYQWQLILSKATFALHRGDIMIITVSGIGRALACEDRWRIIEIPLFALATETELDHLFQWASIGHERTVNQAIRPGLIIVINKDAPDSDQRWLDVDYATKELLRHLELSTKFEDLKEQWRLRGSRISTAQDLILCYYDSFRIICIPSLTPETTHEITIQYSRLYREIRDISRRLRSKRIRAQMNLDVRSFCNYVEHVYNRLARDMLSSVDFHYLASRNTSRPIKFRDHVVALMVKLKEDEENVDPPCDVQETELIKRVIPFLASCIASHSVNDNSQRGPSSAMK
ncbi:MAG: hypothetical protein Q9207_003509 [Kuettlingeria erythrocarpa]